MAKGDNTLRAVVRAVEDARDVQLPITLIVGGNVVSGRIRSAAAFSEGVRSYVARGRAKEGPAAVNLLDAVGAVFCDLDPDEDYLHLSGVRFSSGGQGTTVPEPNWWRVRVSDVSAWMLGKLVPGLPGDPDDIRH